MINSQKELKNSIIEEHGGRGGTLANNINIEKEYFINDPSSFLGNVGGCGGGVETVRS